MSVEHRSPRRFHKEIEDMAAKDGLSYIDACIEFCNQRSIEPDAIAKLINKQLKDKIEVEATALHFLPNRGKLPV
jgi:hypothetical protein